MSTREREREKYVAAQSTVEALTYQLRSGIGALEDPNARQRLAELSDAQAVEVAERISKFGQHIAPAWSMADVELLIGSWSKLK